MILDSSAILAVLFEEERYEPLKTAINEAEILAVGAPTLFETGIVAINRFGLHGRTLVSNFVEQWNVVVTPFGDRHLPVANGAFIRYGKGRHPARLNYGDCMTYATAQVAEEPLLFIGNDFAQTDVISALA